jgi:hypothetical protein
VARRPSFALSYRPGSAVSWFCCLGSPWFCGVLVLACTEALLARALGRQRRRGVGELLLRPRRHRLAPLQPAPAIGACSVVADAEDDAFFRWNWMNLHDAPKGRSGGGGSSARWKEGGWVAAEQEERSYPTCLKKSVM